MSTSRAPTTRLSDVIGQEHAVAMLSRAAVRGRAAHAYLFDGPEGVGKATTARALALALCCPKAPGAGCGACDVCRRIVEGNHPDFRLIDAAELPELAKTTDKNQVRYLRERVLPLAQERPHEAPARVLVFDGADLLTAEMQNAALKTFEEPVPGVHIVLVTSAPDRLLPTIRSRTQRVRFVALTAMGVADALGRLGVERAQAESAAALADGSVGRARTLLEADAGALWDVVGRLRTAAARRDVGAIFDAATGFAGGKDGRESLRDTIALLARLYRDALVAASGAPELTLLAARRADIDALAAAAQRGAELAPLRRALTALVDADTAVLGNVNAVTATERLLFALRPLEQEATRA